jgi:L-asparaginase/Glu-tRNA(Gln) amidotransferase subunit D
MADGEQFTNVASGAITMDQWLSLAQKINDKFKKEQDLAGIVVTSGTDTLEGARLFSSSDRARRSTGRRGRLHAQSEHDGV